MGRLPVCRRHMADRLLERREAYLHIGLGRESGSQSVLFPHLQDDYRPIAY